MANIKADSPTETTKLRVVRRSCFNSSQLGHIKDINTQSEIFIGIVMARKFGEETGGNEAQMLQKRSASKFRLDNIKYRLHLKAQVWKQYRNPP